VHVTVGITVYTWVELLAEWFQTGRADVRFRRALPPGFARNDQVRDALKAQLPNLILQLQQGADYGEMIDAFTRRVQAGELRPPEPFRS
jgi:hypothetical protein